MSTTADLSFGAWIKSLRARRDFTQERLAARVGCAVQTIRTFEAGTRRPSLTLARRLADALELPSAERARFLSLARSVAPAAETRAASPPPAPTRLPNLRPASPPSVELIGREAERARLLDHLRAPGRRLVSLVGPGGIGKTSLALHVAAVDAAGEPAFADGVAVAWLAATASADAAPLALAEALGYAPHGLRPALDQLIDLLRERRMLLVLDNLEHLLGPGDGAALAAMIGRLLAEAPGVRLLATSRERLHLRDEWVFELGGLALPASDSGPRVERADAVRLFVQRACQLNPAFALRADERPAVARLCRRLEGTPLAIELAATWTRALSTPEIAAEVDSALDFLAAGDRDAPARHHSMRAALDHSWRLLDEGERRALARLAVFRGGFDREAAAQVALAALPVLTALIDKSLVRREGLGASTRYTLHELVRQYAAERLAGQGNAADIEARHTAYYAGLLQRSVDPRTGTSTPDVRATLDRDIENLRAAWARAAAAGDTAAVAVMVRGIWILYNSHGWLHDGAALFGLAADALRESAPAAPVRGRVLGLQGYFLVRAGLFAAARPLLEEGLGLIEASGTTEGLADLLFNLGIIEARQGRFALAEGYFTRASALASAAGDRFLTLWSELYFSGLAIFRGDWRSAEARLTECVQGWRSLGDARGETLCLVQLGEVALHQRHLDDAARHLRACIRMAGAARDTWVISMCLGALGVLAQFRGELDEARYLLSEANEGMREVGDVWGLGRCLSCLARVELERGDTAAARRAWAEIARVAEGGEVLAVPEAAHVLALILDAEGAPEAALAILLAAEGVPGDYDALNRVERLREALARRLDDRQRAAAAELARGRPLLPLLAELAARPQGAKVAAPLPPPAGLRVPGTGETLTPREVEVLRMLIAGASNQAIAETLVISQFTAKHHVASILQKLAVSSRTQAALRGRALGLDPLPPR